MFYIHTWQLIYLNIQSFLTNFEELEGLTKTHKSTQSLINETCLISVIKEFDIKIEGYSNLRCDYLSKDAGDVAVYIKNEMYNMAVDNGLHGRCKRFN